MAQLEEAADAYSSAGEAGKPKSKSSTGGRSATKKVVDVSEESEEDSGNGEAGNGEEEEEEEEYEIEAIIDSRRGTFKKGEQAFLVKWKGYGPEHNSWVTEEDAGNAQELINEFLKQKAKAKAQNSKLSLARGHKSTSAKTSKSTKGASPDTESVSVSTSKRGRAKAASAASSSDEEDTRKTKKKRGAASTNGTGSGKRGPLATLDRTDDEDVTMAIANGLLDDSRPYTTMKDLKLATMKNWEDYVKSVSTVERHNEGLMVYFETTDGKYVREPSTVCAKRFPQKLIEFYEAHLRWKVAEGDVPES